MKTEYDLSQTLGTVYRQGNLLFTAESSSTLISPVGNRVSVFDLNNNTTYTIPLAHRKNIACLDQTAHGSLLLSVDEDGRAILTNFHRRIALYHFSFKGPVSTLKFSPSGRYFAVGIGRFVEVWKTPESDGLEFAPFIKHRQYAGHYDSIQSIEWSSDSRFFLTSSKDLTARIWSLDPEEGFEKTALGGHREGLVGAWFSKDQETVSKPCFTGGSHIDSLIDIHSKPRWRLVSVGVYWPAKARCRFDGGGVRYAMENHREALLHATACED